MSWYLIEETEAKPGHFTSVKKRTNPFTGETDTDVEVSTTTIKLRVWRCSSCRALACGTDNPPTECGKCPK